MEGIAAITALLGGISSLMTTAKSVNDIESNKQLIEMQKYLVELQQTLLKFQDENRELRSKVDDLSRRQELHADLETVEDGLYLTLKSERSAGREVPYCPICWGENGKLIPLLQLDRRGSYQCVLHKACYWTQAYRDAQQRESTVRVVARSRWLDRGY